MRLACSSPRMEQVSNGLLWSRERFGRGRCRAEKEQGPEGYGDACGDAPERRQTEPRHGFNSFTRSYAVALVGPLASLPCRIVCTPGSESA